MTIPDAGPTGAALAPVAERYASWLALDRDAVLADREEDPAEVRALQLILRMERGLDPDWYTALELAARGCASLCLDPRAEPGGEWYQSILAYGRGHIRKVTRRARAGHWAAVGEIPGITLAANRTEVRALVPGRTLDLDKRVARLQVGGTDAPRTEPSNEPSAVYPPGAGPLVVHPAPTVPMTLGKAMAQAGHAAMIAAALLAADRPDALRRWYRAALPVVARPITVREWSVLQEAVADPAPAWHRAGLLAVRDAGFTEIEPGTVTMIAEWGESPPGIKDFPRPAE